MALSVSSQFAWNNIENVPLVNVAGGDQAGLDEFAEPRGFLAVVFVVVGSGQGSPLPPRETDAGVKSGPWHGVEPRRV
jgi:hypothetical protein